MSQLYKQLKKTVCIVPLKLSIFICFSLSNSHSPSAWGHCRNGTAGAGLSSGGAGQDSGSSRGVKSSGHWARAAATGFQTRGQTSTTPPAKAVIQSTEAGFKTLCCFNSTWRAIVALDMFPPPQEAFREPFQELPLYLKHISGETFRLVVKRRPFLWMRS